MARAHLTLAATAGLAALFASGCTMHKADTGTFTGPSELGTSITVAVTPDVLQQDGASQSLVTVTARDANGQPLRSLSLRAAITVSGTSTDFGSLSARSLVTDANGKATLVYTAPPAPPVGAPAVNTIVDIAITPVGSDFANETARTASINIVPPGVVTSPSPLRPEFTAPTSTVGNASVFLATVTDSAGNSAVNQVSSFTWDFGDGSTATGQTASHVFTSPGSFPVTLTITDVLGRASRVTHTVTVGQGALPTATFNISPSAVTIGQTVNFNGSGSTAEAGHRITDWSWNFGDGTLGSGALTTHVYTTPGTYTVTLKVTDDAGRKSALSTQTVTVTSGAPTAAFTFAPIAPSVGASVLFDGTTSTAVSGRTIVTYAWSFDGGPTVTGPTVNHPFFSLGAHTVTLTVTDSAGATASTTKTVTVS